MTVECSWSSTLGLLAEELQREVPRYEREWLAFNPVRPVALQVVAIPAGSGVIVSLEPRPGGLPVGSPGLECGIAGSVALRDKRFNLANFASLTAKGVRTLRTWDAVARWVLRRLMAERHVAGSRLDYGPAGYVFAGADLSPLSLGELAAVLRLHLDGLEVGS